MSRTSTNPRTAAERFTEPRLSDTVALLDRVEDRDRAILAMLLERVHPDDIAATLGISAANLKRRHARIVARLRCAPTRRFADSTNARRGRGTGRVDSPLPAGKRTDLHGRERSPASIAWPG
jgi:FixJ family two-component response regulator